MPDPSDDGSPDVRTLGGGYWWEWLIAVGIVVLTGVVMSLALLRTPGDPLACRIPNPGGWWLCGWVRRYVANATALLVPAVAGLLSLAVLAGLSKAVLRGLLE